MLIKRRQEATVVIE